MIKIADVFDQAGQELTNTTLSANSIVGSRSLPETIGFFLQIITGTLGLASAVLIFWAGIRWTIAGGDEKKINTAKAQIIYALVGLVIAILAYSITTFVVQRFQSVTAQPAAITTPAP